MDPFNEDHGQQDYDKEKNLLDETQIDSKPIEDSLEEPVIDTIRRDLQIIV